PDAYKAVWDFHGPWASSRHIPEVRFKGLTHPGIMATAPSAEMLAKWNKREGALLATAPDRVPPLALPPEPDKAVLDRLPRSEWSRAGREAAHTAHPCEDGGDQDSRI